MTNRLQFFFLFFLLLIISNCNSDETKSDPQINQAIPIKINLDNVEELTLEDFIQSL